MCNTFTLFSRFAYGSKHAMMESDVDNSSLDLLWFMYSMNSAYLLWWLIGMNLRKMEVFLWCTSPRH